MNANDAYQALQVQEALVWNELQRRGLSAPNDAGGNATVQALRTLRQVTTNFRATPTPSLQADFVGAYNAVTRAYRTWTGTQGGTLLSSTGVANSLTTGGGGSSGGGAAGGKGWILGLLALGVAGGTAYATRKHWMKWFKKKKK